MLQPRDIILVKSIHTLDRAVKDVPRNEQLFVLMDANARTGRREKGGVGSKDNKSLGAYGRDTLNNNGELLLSFANNHDLAIIVNTFFSTPKGGVSHTFNVRGKKRVDSILTRQRDRKLIRNVTVHPQPSFLPISDHHIVSEPVKLLGHFARNRRLRVSAKPPVDRRRLVTDPQLRQEVATADGRHLRANPPGDSNVDDVEAAFAAAIMRTAELVIPPQERRRPGRGWRGDAQPEAVLQTATDAMHAAWQRLGDQHGFFQNIKSVELEETKKGRITVLPWRGRETAARRRAYPLEMSTILPFVAEL